MTLITQNTKMKCEKNMNVEFSHSWYGCSDVHV